MIHFKQSVANLISTYREKDIKIKMAVVVTSFFL